MASKALEYLNAKTMNYGGGSALNYLNSKTIDDREKRDEERRKKELEREREQKQTQTYTPDKKTTPAVTPQKNSQPSKTTTPATKPVTPVTTRRPEQTVTTPGSTLPERRDRSTFQDIKDTLKGSGLGAASGYISAMGTLGERLESLNEGHISKYYDPDKANIEHPDSFQPQYKAAQTLEESMKWADEQAKKATELKEGAKEGRGAVGSFLFDALGTTTEMGIDSVMRVLTGSGMLSLFARATGNAASELRNSDKEYTNNQIALYSSAIGAVEYLTEKLFAGNAAMKATYGKGALDIAEKFGTKMAAKVMAKDTMSVFGKELAINAAKLGGQMAEESIEELLADLIDPVIKGLVLEDWEGALEDYDIKNIARDMLLGGFVALAGGGSVEAGVNTVRGVAAQKANIATQGQTFQDQYQAAMTYDQDSNIRKLAEDLNKRSKPGENSSRVSGTEINDLKAMNRKASQEKDQSLIEKVRTETERVESENGGVKLGLGEETVKTRTTARQIITEKITDTAKEINTDETIKEKHGEFINSREGTNAVGAIARIENGVGTSEDITTIISSEQAKQLYQDVTGETVSVNNEQAREQIETNVAMKRVALQSNIDNDVRTKLKADTIEAIGSEGKAVYEEVLDKADVAEYDGLTEAMDAIYAKGNVADAELLQNLPDAANIVEGLPKKIQHTIAKKLSNDQVVTLFRAGIVDDQNYMSESLQAVREKKNGKKREGKFSYSGVNEGRHLDQHREDTLKNFARKTGVNIVIVESLGTKGNSHVNGKYSNGTIYLALDSNNPITTVVKHEVTHYIKEFAPKEYKELQDFVFKRYYDGDKAKYQKAIRDKVAEYKAANIKDFTFNDAKEEILADATEEFFMNPDTEEINAVMEQSKGLAKSIKDAIHHVANILSDLTKGDPRNYRGFGKFMRDYDMLHEAEVKWAKALEAASHNDRTKQSGKEKASLQNADLNNAEQIVEEHPSHFSITTFDQKHPIGNVTMSSVGRKIKEVNSGRAITERIYKAAKKDPTKALQFLEDMKSFMEDMGLKYKYIGLDDVNSATVEIRYDRNGKPKSVVMSARIKNGEYPINFDFSTICKKRQAVMKIFEQIVEKDKNGQLVQNFQLTTEMIWEINKKLKAAKVETACLGCFVESKRYNIQAFADKACRQWNTIVDEIRKAEGAKGRTDYFGFSKEFDSTKVDFDQVDQAFADYRDVPGRKSPEARMRALITGHPEYQRYLQPNDFMTPQGIKNMKAIASGDNNLYGILQGVYGQAAPKEFMSFTPYNSEIALMAKTKNGKKMVDYIRSIGGVRMQSFSDFLIQNVFDYMQMVADMEAKDFTAHAYTKEISFAKIFGLTGIKINMSVMFDIDKNFPKEYAGLAFIESPDGDEVFNGKTGTWEYIVADKKRSNEKYQKAFRGYMAQGMSEAEARAKAADEMPFTQSITFEDAVALQRDPRYSKTCGTIGVGYSTNHIIKMLKDKNIRYIIPYHTSSIPATVRLSTNLDHANDYTDWQNTQFIVSLTNADGFQVNLKDLRKNYNSYGEMFADIYQRIAAGTWKFEGTKELKDKKGKTIDKIAEALHEYDVYGKADEMNGDARAVAEDYMKDCAEKNLMPIFPEFANVIDDNGNNNYYKFMFDFNILDCITEEYAPQRAVTATYGDDVKSVIEREMRYQNRINKRRDAILPSITDEVTDNVLDYTDGAEPVSPDQIEGKLSISKAEDSEGNKLTKEQEEFFKDSKARDENGRLLRLYHGTLSGGFTVFDKKKAHMGGNSGAGFYLSSNKADSEANYADVEGADNYFKAQHLADLIESQGEWNGQDVSEMSSDEILALAKKELTKSPQTYEVYANVKNPYYRDSEPSTDKAFGRTIDRSENIFKNIMDDFEEPDINDYEDEEEWEYETLESRDNHLYTKIYDTFYDAVNIVEERIPDNELDMYGSYEDVINDIFEKYLDRDSINFSQMTNVFGEHEVGFYNEDTDEFVDASPELTRAFIEALGYDAIIDKGVSKKFNQLKNMDAKDTQHVIVFNPNQIKLTTNEKPTSHEDIRYSLGSDMVNYNSTAYYTEDRIDNLIGQYASKSSPNYSQGYVTRMSPRKFLELTTDGIAEHLRIIDQSRKLDTKELRNNKQPIYLRVNTDTGKVEGHEGRHRMVALQMAGVREVPVVIVDNREGTKYNKTKIDKITLKGQFREYDTADVQDLEVLSYANRDTLIQKFATPSRNDQIDEDLGIGQNVKFSIRTEEPPKNTKKGYKVFFVKDGKLYPPMVANPNGADTPVGVWLDADIGTQAPDSKTGRKQVKAGGKGTQGGSGSLAFRPGWHLGEVPRAAQFDRTNPETGVRELFPKDFVWAECEIAADVDYQEEAMSYGYNKNGKFQHSLAGLPKLPKNGYYKYRTNPNPDTVPWLITGSMKVTRLLGDTEVNQILEENGLPPVRRQGGDKTLEDLGLGDVNERISENRDIRYSVEPYIGLSEEDQRTCDKRKPVKLSKREYAIIYHEVVRKNALHKNSSTPAIDCAFTDSFCVVYYTHGDDSFKPLYKINLESRELIEEVENEIDRNTKRTYSSIEAMRRSQRRNKNNTPYTERRESKSDDRLDRSESRLNRKSNSDESRDAEWNTSGLKFQLSDDSIVSDLMPSIDEVKRINRAKSKDVEGFWNAEQKKIQAIADARNAGKDTRELERQLNVIKNRRRQAVNKVLGKSPEEYAQQRRDAVNRERAKGKEKLQDVRRAKSSEYTQKRREAVNKERERAKQKMDRERQGRMYERLWLEKDIKDTKTQMRQQMRDERQELIAENDQKVRELKSQIKDQKQEMKHMEAERDYERKWFAAENKQRMEAKENEFKEKKRQDREKRRRRKAENELLTLSKTMNAMKMDNAHRALVDSIIGDLDTTSKSGMKQSTIEKWQDYWHAYQKAKKEDPNFILNPAIEEKLRNLERKHVSEMSVEEIRDKIQILKHIRSTIQNENKFIRDMQNELVSDAAYKTVKQMGNINGLKKGSATYELDHIFINQTLSPIRFIRRITGYHDDNPLYKATLNINEGGHVAIQYEEDALKPFNKLTSDKKFMDDFTGKKAKGVKVEGYVDGKVQEIEVSQAMRVALVLHSYSDDNIRHIGISNDHRGDGAVIPDFNLYRKGNAQAYSSGVTALFTREQFQAMYDAMSDKEKEFLNLTYQYYNETSKNAINKVSLQLYGYELANEENYYPIRIDSNKIFKDADSLKFDGSIEGAGFTKERVENNKPMIIADVNLELQKAIQNHSKYVGLAIPIHNFNLLWRAGTKPGNAGVIEAVDDKFGTMGTKYVDKMITDLQSKHVEDDIVAQALNKLRSKYAGAVLNLNLSVALKQAASYPTAMAVLGRSSLAKALVSPGKVDTNLIAKYTPLYAYRARGYSSIEQGDMKGNNSFLSRHPKLNWIQMVDLATTRKLWRASEIYVRDNNKSLTVGSEAYYKEVAQVYNRVIEETQPNYTTMQRPEILRSDNSLTQALFMFKTQPYQNFNTIYDAWGNARAKADQFKRGEISKDDLKKANKAFWNAFEAQITQLFVFSAMTSLWNAVRRKFEDYEDEEKQKMTFLSWLEKIGKDMLSGASAMIPWGDYAYEGFAALLFDEKIYDHSVPAVETLDGMLNGMVTMGTVIQDSIEFASGDYDSKEDRDAALDGLVENSWKAVLDTSKSVSQAVGFPGGNLINNYNAGFAWVSRVTNGNYYGDYLAKFHNPLNPYNPNYATADVYDLMYKAKVNGDTAAYDKIEADARELGILKPKSNVKKAMEDRAEKYMKKKK